MCGKFATDLRVISSLVALITSDVVTSYRDRFNSGKYATTVCVLIERMKVLSFFYPHCFLNSVVNTFPFVDGMFSLSSLSLYSCNLFRVFLANSNRRLTSAGTTASATGTSWCRQFHPPQFTWKFSGVVPSIMPYGRPVLS